MERNSTLTSIKSLLHVRQKAKKSQSYGPDYVWHPVLSDPLSSILQSVLILNHLWRPILKMIATRVLVNCETRCQAEDQNRELFTPVRVLTEPITYSQVRDCMA